MGSRWEGEEQMGKGWGEKGGGEIRYLIFKSYSFL
jgi:hypothetical protein